STVSPPTPESNTPIGFAAAAPFRRDTRLVDDTRCDLVLRTLELPGKGELSTRTLGDSLPRAYAYVAAPRAVDSRHNAYTAHFAARAARGIMPFVPQLVLITDATTIDPWRLVRANKNDES